MALRGHCSVFSRSKALLPSSRPVVMLGTSRTASHAVGLEDSVNIVSDISAEMDGHMSGLQEHRFGDKQAKMIRDNVRSA